MDSNLNEENKVDASYVTYKEIEKFDQQINAITKLNATKQSLCDELKAEITKIMEENELLAVNKVQIKATIKADEEMFTHIRNKMNQHKDRFEIELTKKQELLEKEKLRGRKLIDSELENLVVKRIQLKTILSQKQMELCDLKHKIETKQKDSIVDANRTRARMTRLRKLLQETEAELSEGMASDLVQSQIQL